MTAAASSWIGYLGPNPHELFQLVGADAQVKTGDGFAVAARNKAGESVRLCVSENETVRATIGCAEENGSTLIIHPLESSASVACDPFGFHNAYYAHINNALWFSSDIRLLEQLVKLSPALNPSALHGYFCFSHIPLPLTTHTQICALMPGEGVCWHDGKIAQRENRAAWHEREPFIADESIARTQLHQQLRAAVARKLGAEKEVGVFLSGGIDSSLIAAMLLELGARVRFYSLDFGAAYDSELEYARQVAEFLGQPLTLVPAQPRHIRKALHQTARALQQPFGDGVTVPLYLLGQAAAGQVEVVFNGEGGDQLFGGWAVKPMLAAELYADNAYNRAETYMRTYHRLHEWSQELYTPRARDLVSQIRVQEFIRPALEAKGFRTLLHRLRAVNLWTKGAQNIAPRARQLAAAHHLKMRAPFFDRALVEWTFSLAPELFLNGATEKYLLKRVAEKYLPSEIVWREKRGMRAPTTEWCLGPLRWETWRWLNPVRLRQQGWFESRAVLELLRGKYPPSEFRSQRLGEKLWMLLFFQVWCDAHQQNFSFSDAEVKNEMHLLQHG